jgi:hypothetical protein
MDEFTAPVFDSTGVQILNTDSVETIWDSAGPGSGNNLYPSEPQNTLKPNVYTAFYGPAPKIEATNDTTLNSTISTLPLTEPLANSHSQIDNVVTRGTGDFGIHQRFACPFRKHDPERYTLPEWRSCASLGFSTLSHMKYAYITVSIYACIDSSL